MDIKKVLIKWSKTDEHHEKIEKARQIVRNALQIYSKPYIAFSGGKDSTCVLHLVLEQCPDIMVLHWDYGPYYIPRWLEKEFIDNARQIGARNIRIETSEKYMRLGRNAINVLGREYLGKLIPQLKQEGYDMAFVGLRKEEGNKRRRRIENKKSISVIPECWPIADWTWKDVWAYIFNRNLPYPSIYNFYAPIVGWDKVRLATFFDPEFDKLGSSNVDGVLMWKFRNYREG